MVSLLQVFGDHSRPKSSQQPLLYMCAISRQIVPRPGAIFSLGYISHLRMLAQLAGTSKRVMVSHPALNSHGHYTRTLEKTSRPFPACCAIVTAERVWHARLVDRLLTAVSHNTNGGNLVLIWKPRTRDLNSSRNLTRKVFSLFLFGD